MLESWKQRVRTFKTEVYALAIAYRDPRTPWYARAWTALVVGYTFSPIDLIPDPIPVLGYLDDLILVPLGIWIALKLIPPDVLVEAREYAREHSETDPLLGRIGGAMIALIWLILLTAVIIILAR